MAWQRVALVVAGDHAATLADALEEEGALSVDTADAEAGSVAEDAIFGEPGAEPPLWRRCRVVALFGTDADASASVQRALAGAGVSVLAAASFDRLEDADWVAETQRQFASTRVGERLWIVPSWHEPTDPGAVNVILDPGAAFGTGSHPTTRLCLAWLERHVTASSAVLDYGCGSGILGIAALKLGAASATGVDVDPLALEAARYNARRNGVALRVVDAGEPFDDRATITVANILANPLRMLAPVLARHTRPAGCIALSGILHAQAQEVIETYTPWGALDIVASEGAWVLIAGERRADRPC